MLSKSSRVVFGLMFILLVTIACSSPSSSPDTNAEGGSADNGEGESLEQGEETDNENQEKDENTLQLLIPNYYNDIEKEQWAQVVDRFKELNPDIDVLLEIGDVRVESGSLTALLQSNVNTPDAILMNAGPSRISVLSDGDLIKPLDDLYEENGWKEQVRPFAYDIITTHDNIYELPHMVDALGFFYNKDIFEKYDLEPPTTQEEFISVLQTISSTDDGIAPITVGARNGYAIGWLYGLMLEAIAGNEKVEDLLFGDGKWTDPEIVKVSETLIEWQEKGYISKEAVTLQETDSKFNFLNKQAAMMGAGTYLITDIAAEDLEDSTGFFMVPSFVEGVSAKPTGGVGQSWVIPTDAKNPELSEIWMEFILSADYAKVVYGFEDYNFILASTASMEIDPAGDILMQAADKVVDGSGYNPSVFNGTETNEAYYQNLQGLVGGLVSPEEAMQAIQEAAEEDAKK